MPITPISRSKSDSALLKMSREALDSKPSGFKKAAFFADDSFEAVREMVLNPVIVQPHKAAIEDLQEGFVLEQVESSFGLYTYQIFNEEKVLETIKKLKHQIESGQLDINRPIIDRLLSSRYVGYPPLAAAAREPNVAVVRELLQLKTIDLNARDNRSYDSFSFRTILMHAVRGAILSDLKNEEAIEALRLLLNDIRILESLNATAESAAGEKMTALDFALNAYEKDATNLNYQKVVKMLVDRGAIALQYTVP